MKKCYSKCVRFLAGTLFLFSFVSSACEASVFIKNENIIDKRAVEKIEIIGKELKDKTGITTHIVAIKSLNNTPLVVYEENLTKNFKPPYILLSISQQDHQVDIKASKDTLDKFDRDGILSPYPWDGTILPILASKKGNDKYSAAILNGYADIADQVASSYNIELKSSIGSSNKVVIGIIKVIFYALVVATIGLMIYFKRKKRRGREQI